MQLVSLLGKAGSMLTGLCALTVDTTGKINTLWARDMDADDLEDCINGEGDFAGFDGTCTTLATAKILMVP